jgi:transposase
MSMGRREDGQTPMWLAGPELARSPGHRFYEKLNDLLKEADFDRRVEQICARYFEADNKPGRPSIAPGVYFRMQFVGYFEGIESERGLEWRCADSLSLRTFLPASRISSSLTRTKRLTGASYASWDASRAL